MIHQDAYRGMNFARKPKPRVRVGFYRVSANPLISIINHKIFGVGAGNKDVKIIQKNYWLVDLKIKTLSTAAQKRND